MVASSRVGAVTLNLQRNVRGGREVYKKLGAGVRGKRHMPTKVSHVANDISKAKSGALNDITSYTSSFPVCPAIDKG